MGIDVGICAGGCQGIKSPATHAMKCRLMWQGQVDAGSRFWVAKYLLTNPWIRGTPEPAAMGDREVPGDTGCTGWLNQFQLGCPFDGRPAAIDVELAVDTLGVRAEGAQGDHELIGDLRPGKLGFEQAENFKLTLA